MGKSSDRTGVRDHITDDQRAEIVAKLKQLDSLIVGERVDLLVDLADTALVSFDLTQRPSCFSYSTDISFLPAFRRYEDGIRAALQEMITAIDRLAAYKRADEIVMNEVAPKNIERTPDAGILTDAFECILADLMVQDDDYNEAPNIETLGEVIANFTGTKIKDPRRIGVGRPREPHELENLVRAACYYRFIEFGERNFYLKTHKSGVEPDDGAERVEPTTYIGILITKLADAFAVQYQLGRIRTYLEKYTALLRDSESPPEQDDFSQFWSS